MPENISQPKNGYRKRSLAFTNGSWKPRTDFHLSADHIARAVSIALELAEKPPLKPTSLPGTPSGSVFEVPILPGSWGRATAGLEHPHTGKRRPITFDHDVAKNRDDVVLAHLNHRLVQMCLRLLREELWKLDDIKKLHRVTVKAVSDEKIQAPIAAVWARLVVSGGDHRRLHEEITLAGGEMKQFRIRQNPANRSSPISCRQCQTDRSRRWTFPDSYEEIPNKQEDSILSAIETRSRERLRYLENTLSRRKENEKKDLLSVLDELELTIRAELKDGQMPKQLELPGFGEEERNQIRRDIEALKSRLARIPEEKKYESDAIEKRYKGLTDRTFPVAVVFLVPRNHMEGR